MPTPKGTVRHATIEKLRDRYHATWKRHWPHDNDYLATLWRESQDLNERGNSRIPHAQAYERCLDAMRECHSFTPEPAPAG